MNRLSILTVLWQREVTILYSDKYLMYILAFAQFLTEVRYMKHSFSFQASYKEAKRNEKIYNKMNLLESIRPEYPHPDFSLSSRFSKFLHVES